MVESLVSRLVRADFHPVGARALIHIDTDDPRWPVINRAVVRDPCTLAVASFGLSMAWLGSELSVDFSAMAADV